MKIHTQRANVSAEAVHKVKKLTSICRPYWRKLQFHPFIRSIRDGTMTTQNFRIFYMQWGKVIGELILTLYANTMSRFNWILLKYPDIQSAVVSHMVEELSHQDINGVYMITARALGIDHKDVIEANLMPELQAYLNWVVKLSYQGTFAEIRASSFANEGCLSSVSSAIAPSLVKNYGLTKDQAAYYFEHGPADREHVKVNAYILSRLIDLGLAEERPGYGLEYCAETICKTNLLMFDGVYKALSK
ncbi:MAG: iron-containing redox enzyme family protein [Conexivisphaerales archaeon]